MVCLCEATFDNWLHGNGKSYSRSCDHRYSTRTSFTLMKCSTVNSSQPCAVQFFRHCFIYWTTVMERPGEASPSSSDMLSKFDAASHVCHLPEFTPNAVSSLNLVRCFFNQMLHVPHPPKVTLEEFIDGLMRCKGPARAIDTVALQSDVRQLDVAWPDGSDVTFIHASTIQTDTIIHTHTSQ